jgi:hypothetical protein
MEPPRLHEARHLRLVEVHGKAALERAREAYEAVVARILRDVEASQKRIEIVRRSTVDGRYDSAVAASVAVEFGLVTSGEPVRRGRGRPRKYGPEDVRPPRPSRPKTPAGRLRAGTVQFPKRGPRASEPRERSGTVSPVTASPARSVAPQVATAVGQALLVDTIAAKQEVVAAAEVVVSITENAIVASPAPVPEAPAFDSRAASELHREGMLAALREVVGGQELTADGEVVLGAFLLAHRQQHHECEADWVRGQNGAKRHDYDFTDPADASKVRPEIRALFKGFGLSRHEPIFDQEHPERGMSEEDLQAWMKQAYFNGIDYPVTGFDEKMAFNKSARAFFWKRRSHFEREVTEERQRFRVWSFIERRLWSVEYYADRLARGEIDLTFARVRVMNDELRFIGRLKLSEQVIYRKVVDAMEWFEGFSRIDLLNWAGDDIANDRQCRIHQRFPAWAYPKELHGALLDGAILIDVPRFDYKAPSSEELVSFAEADVEARIEAVRKFDNLDWADIEI